MGELSDVHLLMALECTMLGEEYGLQTGSTVQAGRPLTQSHAIFRIDTRHTTLHCSHPERIQICPFPITLLRDARLQNPVE